MNKIKNIVRFTSDVIMLLAITMILPLILAFYYNESDAIYAFIETIVFCALIYFITHFFIKKNNYLFKYRDGFVITTIIWFVVTIIGGLPYIFSGSLTNIFDCIFEAASGFTTTGSTVISDVESLPRSIQFWRAMTNWIGGMGILVLLSAVLPSWGVNGQTVAFNESTGPSKGKLTSRFSDNSKILYKLYIGLTIAEILCLMLCGMSLFDAVSHTFATVATGGFSNYNNGLMHFENPMIALVITFFMVLAGLNFGLLLQARNKKGIKELFNDEEVKCYLFIFSFATLSICIYNLLFYKSTNIGKGLLDSAFQVASIITTTGFATVDFDLWPTFSKIMMFTLFFVGACSSSTAGGVKCIRIVVWWKLIKRNISVRLHPNRIYKITINDKEMSSDTVIRVTTFILTFYAMLMIGTLLISFDGFDLVTNLSAAASSIGNVGPGFNLVGATLNYSIYSNFSKVVCSLLMIAGRLEVLTVFTIFSRNYWNVDSIH